ncbi:hypothetical protein [Streptomyces sp. CBMA123]|uniref:hypothetical protein n=1 Tax=Streptomyces sp. CBMA123 TaxID=1896313 RepID=UPI001661AC25|nr:hypothetical protein [Streptomyces sp. CBMA123]MBD0689366.1 hypothetical protein [Streptomyces sp. CBMA123]
MAIEDRGGFSAAWVGAAVVSFTVLAIVWPMAAADHSTFPWWPTYLCAGLGVITLYLGFATVLKWWPARERPTVHVESSTAGRGRDAADVPAAPVVVRLSPEFDTATNRLRLGVLNRGDLGRFRVKVIDAHDQDGGWVGPRSWPVPWLEDGSVDAKAVPKFDRPLLDLAGFDFPALREDLEGTKWLRGDHWVFPSLPKAVTFRYQAVRAWAELKSQHIILTLRVIRDEPEGNVDYQFQIGTDGTEPYCLDLSKLPEEPEQENAIEPEPASALGLVPAVTDHWHHTTNGAEVGGVMNMSHSMMSHPGYGGRQWEDAPPVVKVGMLVGCEEMDQAVSGTELRAKLAAFLDSAAVREVVGSLTHVPADAAWTNLAGRGLLALEAALTAGDDPMEGTPVASALFLPPTGGSLGRPARTAALLLYVEPRTADGQVPPASGLVEWYRRINLGLAVPAAFAEFLTKDLGLGTFAPPAAQFGVWLESRKPLTTMVGTDGLRTLPGSPLSNQFIGWAYADLDGKPAVGVARDMMLQMCEYELHLDNFESVLPESLG